VNGREVPPEVYAAYLTDGPENEAIMALYKKTGTMQTAIEAFVKPLKSKSLLTRLPFGRS
jgi:hypothetical protein